MTWFCPGAPTWNCQDLGLVGGWNTKADCCAKCNDCRSGTGTGIDTGTVGKVCNDPLKIGCTFGIPNTYLLGLAGIGIYIMKKKR